MKPSYKLLVLTDHSRHSKENSLYGFVRAFNLSPFCHSIAVCTRAYKGNEPFFSGLESRLFVKWVTEDFINKGDHGILTENLSHQDLGEFDLILLRLPPPPDQVFFKKLSNWVPERFIINQPAGILKTSSKAFLMHFQNLCPPIKICETVNDVRVFSSQFPIVLKPLNGYGGQGIIKIQNDVVWKDGKVMGKTDFFSQFEQDNKVYLGMKYLKNVSMGDKRNIVVNGKLLGASLRLPVKGGWMCNVAAGGSSTIARPDHKEEYIASELWRTLKDFGIAIFGFDTLVDDNGERVLSEINSMSVGGLIQTTNYEGKPILNETVDLLWNYINEVVYGNVSLHFR